MTSSQTALKNKKQKKKTVVNLHHTECDELQSIKTSCSCSGQFPLFSQFNCLLSMGTGNSVDTPNAFP